MVSRSASRRRSLSAPLPPPALGLAFVLALVIGAGSPPDPVHAQIDLWTLKGRQPEIRFGQSLRVTDDVDGDGTAEILIGAPGYADARGADVGRLYVVSGTTLEPIRVVTGAEAGEHFGGVLDDGADFDGDGVRDWLIGCGRSYLDCDGTCEPPVLDGTVRLLSGATGATLWELPAVPPGSHAGAAVALVPDSTGDGIPEIAYGSTGVVVASHTEAGRLTVLSGADRTELYSIEGRDTRMRLGASIAVLDDADGDGAPDLAFGAPGFLTTAGEAAVVSGPAGRPLRVVRGIEPDERFGFAVARLDDLDGDGRADLGVGAPGFDDGRGRVLVFGSTTVYRQPIRQWTGDSARGRFGRALAAAGDLEGDGIGDVAIGAPGIGANGDAPGSVRVLSGADGAVVLAADGKSARDRFGLSLAAGLGGPVYSDTLVGAPEADPGGRESAGTATLLRVTPRLPCAAGTVNSAGRNLADVLFVNGGVGSPTERTVRIERDEALGVFLDVPPSRTTARFVLYAYAGFPNEESQTPQPFGIGTACFPTPLSGDFELPREIWNNLGEPLVFGEATRSSEPAPTVILDVPGGVGRRLRGTLQGIIRDDASESDRTLSLTNAVLIDVL